MGFENLFFHNDTKEEEKIDTSRRRFLKGGAAAAATAVVAGPAALMMGETPAHGAEQELDIISPEEKERNLEAIRRYQGQLEYYRDVLEGAVVPENPRELINAILYVNLPKYSRPYLEGTQYDHEAWFKKIGWPAVQIPSDPANIRFAEQENIDVESYTNGFFIEVDGKNLLITNDALHKYGIPAKDGTDIESYPVTVLVPGSEIEARIEHVSTQWDPDKANEDLHGKLVHIPTIHENRGDEAENDRDITTGTLFKITPTILEALRLNRGKNEQYVPTALNSYALIVPLRDTNDDGVLDNDDVKGISGAPVYTDEDCRNRRNTPSGIVTLTVPYRNPQTGEMYSLIFIHGGDILAGELEAEEVTSDEDAEPEEAEHAENEPEHESAERMRVVALIQEALNDWRESRNTRPIKVDGLYGSGTQGAVYAFQRAHFASGTLYVPGVVDELTWHALLPGEPYNGTVGPDR